MSIKVFAFGHKDEREDFYTAAQFVIAQNEKEARAVLDEKVCGTLCNWKLVYEQPITLPFAYGGMAITDDGYGIRSVCTTILKDVNMGPFLKMLCVG